MNTMQATPAARQPQPLLSTGARFAAVLAVAGLVSAACLVTAHESREAVQLSTVAMAPRPIYVTLPPVEIVARRRAVVETAVAASHTPHAAL
jgi:hypothetical protein